MRRKLTPDMPFGCKRPLASNVYYPTFNRPNVELVVDPIDRDHRGRGRHGRRPRARVDTIILATGFATTKFLAALDVVGRDGVAHRRRVVRRRRRPTSASPPAGFPNLFMLYGPNTNNGSIIFMIECQVEYVMRDAATRWTAKTSLGST